MADTSRRNFLGLLGTAPIVAAAATAHATAPVAEPEPGPVRVGIDSAYHDAGKPNPRDSGEHGDNIPIRSEFHGPPPSAEEISDQIMDQMAQVGVTARHAGSTMRTLADAFALPLADLHRRIRR